MQIKALDHVNVRTYRLDEMVAWYSDVLGMPSGDRPDFPFPGAWIYAGDKPVIHLVGIEPEAPQEGQPQIEHFALSASGIKEMVARLEAHNVEHRVSPVPGLPLLQLHLHDPDGNHIHIDFNANEVE